MVHTAVQSSLRSKVDPHGRALIRKTSFASRSIRRQKAVKLSPTGRQVRSSSLHPNACRIARLALATHCKQYALCRSLGTISLHDVRQHATSRHFIRSTIRLSEFVFFFGRVFLRQVDRITAGGARRDRTDDLLLAKQALSQLSYGPAPVTAELGYPAEAGRNGGPGKI